MRSAVLYLCLGLALYVFVNRDAARINRLNSLKEVERHLYQFSEDEAPFDREAFRWGARYFKELLKISPDNGALYGNLAFCYYYLGDRPKAIASYKKALSLDNKFYTHHLDLGLIYFFAQDYEKATPYFQTTISQITPTVQYYLRLGQRLQEKGKDEISKGVYHLISKAQKDEAKAYEYLIKCFFYSREYVIMREVALLGVKAQPEHQPLIYNLGLSNYLLKNYEEAAANFSQAILLDPQDTNAYYYRSLCMDKLGRRREYFMDFQKLLRLKDVADQGAKKKDETKLHLTSDLQAMEVMVNK